jgi:von Willebrand factor type A domain
MLFRITLALVVFGFARFDEPRPQDRPVFRVESDIVSVNVSVRQGNRPVANLRAGDFQLFDNGVPQVVHSVAIQSVPVDVTLVIDVSGSVIGSLEKTKADVATIASLLESSDRLRVLVFSTKVSEVMPLREVGDSINVSAWQDGGLSAVNEAIVTGLITPSTLGRSQLVVCVTDGRDNMSAIDAATVVEVARRSEAVLYVATVGGNGFRLQIPPKPVEGVAESGIESLDKAATSTGGGILRQGLFRGSLVESVRAVFADFRQSYVLTFRPDGVARTGWHELAVKLSRPGNYSVQARRGYFAGR